MKIKKKKTIQTNVPSWRDTGAVGSVDVLTHSTPGILKWSPIWHWLGLTLHKFSDQTRTGYCCINSQLN